LAIGQPAKAKGRKVRRIGMSFMMVTDGIQGRGRDGMDK